MLIEPGAFKSGLSALEISTNNLRRARRLFVLLEQVKRARRPDLGRLREKYQARRRHERAWKLALEDVIDGLFAQLDLDDATIFASTSWKRASRTRWTPIYRQQPPSLEDVQERLAAGLNRTAWEQGAVELYLGLAIAASEEAGQFSLDALGLNRTFAWAQPRAMAQDLFAVRGSKVIQNMYGNHLDELTKIIVRATDPKRPLPLAEVKREIQERWSDLKAWQVERIARTETAAVWTTTSANAYAANGITSYQSVLAHGPTIGIQSADPCPICVELAGAGELPIDGDLPPWHPGCRCEAIPILETPDGDPWLPPDEPWAGEDIDGLVETPLPATSTTASAAADSARGAGADRVVEEPFGLGR